MFKVGGNSPPRQLVETQDLDTMLNLLRHTDMLAILSSEVAERCADESVVVMPLKVSCQMEGFGLITCSGRALSKNAAELMSILRTVGHAYYDHLSG